MALINETPPIAPVLPAKSGNGIRQGQPRPGKPRDKEKQKQHPQDRDGDHRVDEYA